MLRDIDALSTAGIPVYAERGRRGGFALLAGFSTDLTGLTSDEALALLVAGRGQRRRDGARVVVGDAKGRGRASPGTAQMPPRREAGASSSAPRAGGDATR